ncbi:malate dehydrogenase [Chionoecetes opilio]|uniref:Malate dehydrogenase n=1 Tax=Chionoecetes opilio TaxID=41210 RepID=A0A8J4XZD7_CHIOP|nr:malate dehydrogenase [Chionoecetes opilio]
MWLTRGLRGWGAKGVTKAKAWRTPEVLFTPKIHRDLGNGNGRPASPAQQPLSCYHPTTTTTHCHCCRAPPHKPSTPLIHHHRNLSTTNMSLLSEEKAKFTAPGDLSTKYKVKEVHRYMVDCMTAVGTPKGHAAALADVLVAADCRGHFSHGLNRLEMYVNDVKQKICNGGAVPSITKESVSTALVHGNNGLGPVVGNFCMDLAVKKAKETGIGWVCTRGSNHYGIAGWYSMRASKEGLLGMSVTNTSPLVAPTRAKKPALGTNPLSVAAPGKDGDDFVLDMATCVVALGKIEIERRKDNPIPEGWALDKDGKPTTNATEGMQGALMPLGGTELHSGYKGFGLGMLVEVFCGIMSGGQYGPNVRRGMQTDKEADLGQAFMALDPSFFAPGFEDRLGDLMNHCRNMEPADPSKPVLVAGDPERQHIGKVEEEDGITYHINQINDSWKLAKALNVKPMQ